MKTTPSAIPDVVVVEPKDLPGARGGGGTFECFSSRKFSDAIGRSVTFVEDNESRLVQAVLRGLYYQLEKPHGKLVRVTHGEVFYVAVDLRRRSPTFGEWVGETLTEGTKRQLWIPEGFAHGFLVLSESAAFQYKTTDYSRPEYERCIRYDDPDIGIQWPVVPYEFPIALAPLVSEKDRTGASLKTAELF